MLPDLRRSKEMAEISRAARAFDRWIRTAFVEINTALEELYFAQQDRAAVIGVGDDLKATLRDEGKAHVAALLAEGNTGDGFDSAFDVLGNVGLYLGALRRHEMTNPDRDRRSPFVEASALSLHVGASIGMAPRFATAHLATRNQAVHGIRKSFTTLPDEFLFIDENTRGILSLQSAADALDKIVPLGVTSPVADVLFAYAATAFEDVIRSNERLFSGLDADRFFFCVRPYYKPYHVGPTVFRGANAGDFSGINEVDLTLGLCRGNDPYYAQLLADKMLYMPPADQQRLRDCLRRRSLLDELLALIDDHADATWFKAGARAFLRLCDLFGRTAAQHHDQLVARFIVAPAADMPVEHHQGLTASGPPLPVLIRSLETLRDYRMAAPRDDIPTRHADLARLRAGLG
jgi:hypothetical protein